MKTAVVILFALACVAHATDKTTTTTTKDKSPDDKKHDKRFASGLGYGFDAGYGYGGYYSDPAVYGYDSTRYSAYSAPGYGYGYETPAYAGASYAVPTYPKVAPVGAIATAPAVSYAAAPAVTYAAAPARSLSYTAATPAAYSYGSSAIPSYGYRYGYPSGYEKYAPSVYDGSYIATHPVAAPAAVSYTSAIPAAVSGAAYTKGGFTYAAPEYTKYATSRVGHRLY